MGRGTGWGRRRDREREEEKGRRGKGKGQQEIHPGSLECSVSLSSVCITDQAWRRWSVPYARNVFNSPKWHFVLTTEDKIHMQYLSVIITLFIYPNVCNKTTSKIHSTLNQNELRELASCFEYVKDILNVLFRLNCSHLPMYPVREEFSNGNCQWYRIRSLCRKQWMACKGKNPYSAHRGMGSGDLVTQGCYERPKILLHSKSVITAVNEKNSRLLHVSNAEGSPISVFWRKDTLHETTMPTSPVFYSASHVVSILYLIDIYVNLEAHTQWGPLHRSPHCFLNEQECLMRKGPRQLSLQHNTYLRRWVWYVSGIKKSLDAMAQPSQVMGPQLICDSTGRQPLTSFL